MQEEYEKLLEPFGGHIKFRRRLRICLTPHSLPIYVYECRSTDSIDGFGDAKDTVLQRLRWINYLKKNENQEYKRFIRE